MPTKICFFGHQIRVIVDKTSVHPSGIWLCQLVFFLSSFSLSPLGSFRVAYVLRIKMAN